VLNEVRLVNGGGNVRCEAVASESESAGVTNQEDPNQRAPMDPRAVPVAVASVALIVLGLFLTYASTTFGALVVLLGLVGVAWLCVLVTSRSSR
jgi:hypothetical protein